VFGCGLNDGEIKVQRH